MKNAKYTRKKTTSKQNKRKKTAEKSSNLSFAIQMIALFLVLHYVTFGISTVPTPSEATRKTEISTQEADIPAPASEEIIPEQPVIPEDALPLEIHQIDVSCANAYLIRYDNFTVFVDGGQSFAYDEVVKHLDNFGVKSIDCYIATHWHKDHVANMVNLLNQYAHERTIVYGPSTSASGKYYVPKGTYAQLTAGASFEIGDVGFLCVGPDEVTQNGTINPDSLNILVQYKNFKFLMTGDYMKDSVIKTFGELVQDIDVLQMPHHGLSPLCISEGALKHCNPTTILVPADASKPTHEVVSKLGLNAKILDNTNGCIAVVSYGEGYQVYTDISTPNDLQ